MSQSTIITKTSEIADRTLNINHVVSGGESLIIAVKDDQGTEKVLLEILVGTDYTVTLEGTVTDKKVNV